MKWSDVGVVSEHTFWFCFEIVAKCGVVSTYVCDAPTRVPTWPRSVVPLPLLSVKPAPKHTWDDAVFPKQALVYQLVAMGFSAPSSPNQEFRAG